MDKKKAILFCYEDKIFLNKALSENLFEVIVNDGLLSYIIEKLITFHVNLIACFMKQRLINPQSSYLSRIYKLLDFIGKFFFSFNL